MVIYMNKRKDLCFGTRKIQKVRHSYSITIPKALAGVLGLEEGIRVNFTLNSEAGRIILQPEMGQ